MDKKSTIIGTIHAKDVEISVITPVNSDDYISLTDMARYRNSETPGYIIQNWLRNRSTVDFLGLWEQMNNADFNCLEFEAIKEEERALSVLNNIKI